MSWIRTTLIFFICTEAVSQTATYNDVAVIINLNSALSDSIGSYFVYARNIPAQNVIYITAPVTEEIDDTLFRQLRSQVELHLLANNIADSINYIVTTKGVPLKVLRSNISANASVESELSLILGPYSHYVGCAGRRVNPYFRQHKHFLRKNYGIYLVTRLDGYTFDDVKNIIDRSTVIDEAIPPQARFVFDTDPLWNPILPNLNTNMLSVAAALRSRGYTVKADTTTTYLTGESDVIGYTGWGSNDKNASLHGRVYNIWMRGAIAETYVSTSGRTFTSPPTYGQSLIADLISEGITAVKGYVYEPYCTAMAEVTTLFDMYSSGYTVAESYYSASPYVSWMDVIIGDPKFRLISARLPSDTGTAGEKNLPVELISFTAVAKGKGVELAWRTATEVNNHGFAIERKQIPLVPSGHSPFVKGETSEASGGFEQVGFVEGNGNSNVPKSYSFVDAAARGRAVYRLKQIDNDGKFEYSNQVEVVAGTPKEFALMQNHPNPFNPATEIRYQMSEVSRVSLKVYDMLGRVVATLVNEVKEAGEYTADFNASQYPSGIYFYALRTSNFTATKKMLMIK